MILDELGLQFFFFFVDESLSTEILSARRMRWEAPVAVKIAQQTFLKQIKAVEHALDDGRHWILGTQFTGADILLVTALLWGKRSKLILSAKLDAYASRAAIRPAYRAACSASGRQP